MAKKLYRIFEKESAYRVHYAWADSESDLGSILCSHSEELESRPFEAYGYTWSSEEVEDRELVPPGRILNSEDEE